jgi:hypothetical protein
VQAVRQTFSLLPLQAFKAFALACWLIFPEETAQRRLPPPLCKHCE